MGRPRGRVEETRERLLRLGAGALTDPELLSVLFSGGSGRARLGEDAVTSVLTRSGGLKALVQQEGQRLGPERRALGTTRTAQLLAAVELGRRLQRPGDTRPRLCTPDDIYRYLAPTLSALPREVFHVLALNSRNVLVGDVRVAEGTVTTCPVDPRTVFAVALSTRASAIVLAHNHPSGDPEPSREDLQLTRQLADAGRLLCVRVLDHLVIGDGRFVSLLARGLLSADGQPRREACSAFGDT